MPAARMPAVRMPSVRIPADRMPAAKMPAARTVPAEAFGNVVHRAALNGPAPRFAELARPPSPLSCPLLVPRPGGDDRAEMNTNKMTNQAPALRISNFT